MGRKVSKDQMVPGNNYSLGGFIFTYVRPFGRTQGIFHYVGGKGNWEVGYEVTLGMFNWEQEGEPRNNRSALPFLDKEW